MRFSFLGLPGEGSTLPRPVVPVHLEGLEEAPQLCLVDTGSTGNRFGLWLAEAIGIDLAGAPMSSIVVGGLSTTGWATRVQLTVAGHSYDAPVTFCDPWPFGFNLLGQEGFLRLFRVTICAAEYWLEIEPEETGR